MYLSSAHFNLPADWRCHENVMEKTQIDSNESGTNAEEKGNKAERAGYTAISRR
jgi:hypothetical protein